MIPRDLTESRIAYQIFEPDARSNYPNRENFVVQGRDNIGSGWMDSVYAAHSIDRAFEILLLAKGDIDPHYWRIVSRAQPK